ncbi:SRR1-like protein [Ischnura elegans]|uniref:SRR1-like protein n=1 Tax=Ischnura elegans TaxID=197161 RepID=UPI001ED8B83A|nr:SRR1-like protein [Ischnura elegans]
MQDADFVTVISKRKSKRQTLIHRDNIGDDNTDVSVISEEVAVRRIEAAKSDIVSSDFYSSVLTLVRQALSLLDIPSVEEILCYGLGHFSECMTSRYQCALLFLLKENFGAKVLIHDPIFSSTECRILRSFGCEVIIENEEGSRTLSGRPTLVFLPHCPKQLTDNFLRANWSPQLLSSCLLLSNSLSHLVETQTKRELTLNSPCSLALYPHLVELGLVNSFRYSDIFNDTALHVFPTAKLSLAAQDLWDIQPPLGYTRGDIEFISKKEKPSLKSVD